MAQGRCGASSKKAWGVQWLTLPTMEREYVPPSPHIVRQIPKQLVSCYSFLGPSQQGTPAPPLRGGSALTVLGGSPQGLPIEDSVPCPDLS